MEDIKAYIESGILELYVLGDMSPAEKLQVEELALKHPAIKAELDEIERSMELYAEKNAVEPVEHLRGRILNSLLTNFADDSTFDKVIEKPKDNVVAFSAPKTTNFYKYAFAACLALLLASIVALVSMYNKLQDSNSTIAALQSDKQHFANTVSLKEGELEVLQDASFKFLKLQATTKAPTGSQITVAWSPAKKKVWIDMKSLKMPENDKEHQYQLWALVAGKPVDLGVFDANADTADMKQMKSIASADAFAVTLEPKGGSPTPTMDEMMVIGKF
ncbi:anti-sigma factor [Mucilaginibacter gotjawali]|uniref:Anti-sigma-K factor RskA n=2 Tax=Mucilaginibacter gotjawali TaxID=1550579 RepID=A0A839SIF9_9SPHI|nr:anti-sigma factor [Mucilaginibacter gotjawali]MBB3058101.1 anti-sigma-K factor RskA [Mucilaginibacter gotjawali]BAU52076.1 Anti-sigma-K factor rskA [Mucilaginibacter gotjawali]